MIFQTLKAHTEAKRMEADANTLDRLTATWLDTSRAMELGVVMSMFWFFVRRHPDANSKGLHSLANRLSRRADELERVGL